MHLLLIRHGQSTNNVVEAEKGDGADFNAARLPDPALSPLGERQAEALGEYLAPKLENEKVTLFVSGMKRALQTMLPLATKLCIPPLVRPDTFERGGLYTKAEDGSFVQEKARSAEEIQEEFPTYNVSELVGVEWGRVERSDKECFERAGRVVAWLRDMAKRSSAGDVVVFVSHMDFLDHMAKHFLGLRYNSVWMKLDNVSISHLVVRGDREDKGWGNGEVEEEDEQAVIVIKWNSTPHLKGIRSGLMWKTMRLPETSWLID